MFGKKMRLAFGVLVVAALACSSPLPTTEGPAAPAAGAQPGLTLGLDALRPITCLLPDSVAVDIGPLGGTITLGGNSLVVPPHALSSVVHILMLPAIGKPGAVQFFPEGLVFAPSAPPTLTLNTDCVGNPPNAYIVYTTDLGRVLEKLPTTARTAHSVSAQIHHFSRYAVAW